MNLRFVFCLTLLSFLSSVALAPRAHALTGGEAVLAVGGGALAGTILGASTLPFYTTPGDHTKNIWVGSAVGAVVGVLVAAAVGFQQTKESSADDEASIKKLDLSPALQSQLHYNTDSALAWSPITTLRF